MNQHNIKGMKIVTGLLTTCLILLTPVLTFAQTGNFSSNDDDQDQTSVTLTDTFESRSITTTFFYQGNEKWKYSVQGGFPNLCYEFEAQYKSNNHQLVGLVTPPDKGEMCPASIKDISESGIISAPQDTEFTFSVKEKGQNSSDEKIQSGLLSRLIEQFESLMSNLGIKI